MLVYSCVGLVGTVVPTPEPAFMLRWASQQVGARSTVVIANVRSVVLTLPPHHHGHSILPWLPDERSLAVHPQALLCAAV